MATTINAQNALQIREQPMDVYVNFQTGSSATISSYSVTSTYKSDDSTLDETSWSMRRIADLQGDGFPLDGSYELYDSSITPDSSNGKLGVRGVTGSNVVIAITSSTTMTSVTVATENADTITVGGTSYTATGLNVIPINAKTATLTITPTDANSRVYVDYIVPGVILQIDNNNLLSCTLALRSNLNVADHTWEESEIEVQVYYPYSIADSFAYVQNDWPITYQAGYDADLSTERKFYLSEPIEQVDNVITIKGVDASHWLDEKKMAEQWFTAKKNYSHKALYDKFCSAITSSGITLKNKQSVSATNSGTLYETIIPEMTARDFVAGVMNLTINRKINGVPKGIQFVDAGIPSVEYGDGTMFGSTWSINKSDCGEWAEVYEQNIATIKDASDERKFAENMSVGSSAKLIQTANETTTGQTFDISFDSYYKFSSITALARSYRINSSGERESYWKTFYHPAGKAPTIIQSTPQRVYFRVKYGTDGTNYRYGVYGYPVNVTSGVKSYNNSNNLPGITVSMEPFVYGRMFDKDDGAIFSYGSLFNRSNKTISFIYKGDPRWQPLDYLAITDDVDNLGTTQYRITNIELTHDGGGTQAKIEAREWDTNTLKLVLGDDDGNALVDDDGDGLEIQG